MSSFLPWVWARKRGIVKECRISFFNSPDWELEKSISLKLSRMAFLSLIPRSIDYNRFMQLLKDFPSFVTLVIRNMHMFGV